jgi:hypothetical protein
MTKRDDFPQAVRDALAERAGHRCSFPGCPAHTIGPSSESPHAVSDTGVAAHISAASGGKGARRYVATLTSQERKSIDNGIWMCSDHGRLVDTDETRYSIEMLRTWRKLAEERARLRQALSGHPTVGDLSLREIGLAQDKIAMDALPGAGEAIGWAVHDSCMSEVWGRDIAYAVRDFLIEHVRNSFEHGKATRATLEIEPHRIMVSDDGTPFGIQSLLAQGLGSGGSMAARVLAERFGSRVLLSQNTVAGRNCLYVAFIGSRRDISKATPCSVELLLDDIRQRRYNLDGLEGCERIYVLLPPFTTFSDGARIQQNLENDLPRGKAFVLVVSDVSSAVQEHIRSVLPKVEILDIPE